MSEWISCLTSQLTIFQSYMWRHIDVQADWRRSRTYGRAPNVIDISFGSITCTCPSKHRHGTGIFIRWFRHTAPISRILRSRWGYWGHILDLTPRALTWVFSTNTPIVYSWSTALMCAFWSIIHRTEHFCFVLLGNNVLRFPAIW